MKKLPISICIIAKNSQKTLEKTIKSVKDLIEEVIVLDTGSKDDTPLIAKKFGAKVYSHLWKYDFSEARNATFQYVSQPWILCLDSDEELIIENFSEFEKNLLNTTSTSFYINIQNILDSNEVSNLYRCRLLKTACGYRYSGRLHETPNIEAEKSEYLNYSMTFIKHYGYNSSFANPKEKSFRNIEILKKDLNYKNIDSWDKVYNAISLVKELSESTLINEKLELLILVENFINSKTKEEVYHNIISLSFFHEIIQFYEQLKEIKKEEFYCLKGLEIFPNDLNLLAMTGEFFYKQGKYLKSIEYYEKILLLVKHNAFMKEAYIYQGIKDYGTFYNLYLCYKAIGNHTQAKAYLDKCLEVNPNFKS